MGCRSIAAHILVKAYELVKGEFFTKAMNMISHQKFRNYYYVPKADSDLSIYFIHLIKILHVSCICYKNIILNDHKNHITAYRHSFN